MLKNARTPPEPKGGGGSLEKQLPQGLNQNKLAKRKLTNGTGNDSLINQTLPGYTIHVAFQNGKTL